MNIKQTLTYLILSGSMLVGAMNPIYEDSLNKGRQSVSQPEYEYPGSDQQPSLTRNLNPRNHTNKSRTSEAESDRVLERFAKMQVTELNSDQMYKNAQVANDLFFLRSTKNPAARIIVDAAKKDMDEQKIPQVDLTGFSHRTRILMIRELHLYSLNKYICLCKMFNIDPYNNNANWGLKFLIMNQDQSKCVVSLLLLPSVNQAGNAKVLEEGKYSDVFEKLKALQENKKLKKIIDGFYNARKTPEHHQRFKQDYGNYTGERYALDFLLDFEVSRRLLTSSIGVNGLITYEDKVGYDSNPIGVCISEILKFEPDDFWQVFMQTTNKNIIKAVNSPQKDTYKTSQNSGGNDNVYLSETNIFSGYKNKLRSNAAKKVLEKGLQSKLESATEIPAGSPEYYHQQLLEAFGGASESESDESDSNGDRVIFSRNYNELDYDAAMHMHQPKKYRKTTKS
ncbi:hypothetical protein [Candidatus Nesciobacter abundans]|uniref:Uncharacterized protein n=1 Tax=Candidatus Nesciobacter abundans TaxID=2601668 RepID=A0A5C0UH10_9PROT|nr:hypothetical protein [Candidatus Nesciobacter abundans]QEK39089.1 hypothetical protein FZC36_01400 [Candidatus Nesciobacter abundans]